MSTPESVVQRQLDAYNAKDLTALLATYAPDAKQYAFPGQLLASGRDEIGPRMAQRFAEPDLHARLLDRTVIGSLVTDHEEVTRNFPEGRGRVEMLATYEVKDGLIQNATFVFGERRLDPVLAPPAPRWVVVFSDTPEMLAVRRERESRHLAYLQTHHSEILIGGGLREAPGEPFVGGLWILDVPSRDRAVALIEGDPYYDPRWRTYRLLSWGKAWEERPVVL